MEYTVYFESKGNHNWNVCEDFSLASHVESDLDAECCYNYKIVWSDGVTMFTSTETYPNSYHDETLTRKSVFNLEELESTVEDYETDNVNHPSHYTSSPNGIETIDAIEASMTPEEFRGFLKGNALKYLFRLGKKDTPVQDLGKAQWYLNKLMTKLEELGDE